MNAETRICQNCQQKFVIEPEDFGFYEKIKVPAPTFCWLCRAQRRLAFRGERRLYKRKSDFSGKEILSMYAPEATVKVYEKDIWLSDSWDPMKYARDVDFSKPFIQQVAELIREAPLKNLNIVGNAPNSEYTNHITDPKNSYLVFNSNHPEDCGYSNGITFSKGCYDVSYAGKSEWCYQAFWINSCAHTIFSSHCEGSYDLMFCKDCVGCNNCIASVGLRNKQYHIFNEPYTKEEYEKKLKALDLSSYKNLQELAKKARAFWLKFPNKYIIGTHNNTVSGNYIEHSKNVKYSFLVREGENLKYCQYVQELPGSKDCYDYSIWGDNNRWVYECCACGINTANIKSCVFVMIDAHDIEYSYACSSSSDLFGCVALQKKQYCILNKQYSKEEYKDLVEKIKKHMDEMPYVDKRGCIYKYGEFFPAEISPFAYNDSVAQEYFPLSREEILANGSQWSEPLERDLKITLSYKDLPDKINEVKDSIKDEVIGCEHEGKCEDGCTIAFRIIPDELDFYRTMKLPVPRQCPSCRHWQRLQQRTSFRIWKRKCQCTGVASENQIYKNTAEHAHKAAHCPNEFETSYAPERPEIVYCERCYQAEVV